MKLDAAISLISVLAGTIAGGVILLFSIIGNNAKVGICVLKDDNSYQHIEVGVSSVDKYRSDPDNIIGVENCPSKSPTHSIATPTSRNDNGTLFSTTALPTSTLEIMNTPEVFTPTFIGLTEAPETPMIHTINPATLTLSLEFTNTSSVPTKTPSISTTEASTSTATSEGSVPRPTKTLSPAPIPTRSTTPPQVSVTAIVPLSQTPVRLQTTPTVITPAITVTITSTPTTSLISPGPTSDEELLNEIERLKTALEKVEIELASARNNPTDTAQIKQLEDQKNELESRLIEVLLLYYKKKLTPPTILEAIISNPGLLISIILGIINIPNAISYVYPVFMKKPKLIDRDRTVRREMFTKLNIRVPISLVSLRSSSNITWSASFHYETSVGKKVLPLPEQAHDGKGYISWMWAIPKDAIPSTSKRKAKVKIEPPDGNKNKRVEWDIWVIE